MLTAIQIVFLLFIIFALSRVILRLREKVISLQVAIFWSSIWLTAFAGILSPQTTSRIAEFLGVGRGVDMIIYGSLALLFYLVFRIYIMVEDLRHEITEIIRIAALQKTPKTKIKSKK